MTKVTKVTKATKVTKMTKVTKVTTVTKVTKVTNPEVVSNTGVDTNYRLYGMSCVLVLIQAVPTRVLLPTIASMECHAIMF